MSFTIDIDHFTSFALSCQNAENSFTNKKGVSFSKFEIYKHFNKYD